MGLDPSPPLLSLTSLTYPYRTTLGQVRYSRLLEEGDFRGRTGDFVWFLLFCAALMIGAAPFLAMSFLGRPLAFMMVYVWGRWGLRTVCTIYNRQALVLLYT